MARYKGRYYHENTPHIYALAEDAFRNMRNEKQSHCVIISGESGAGKTECAKMVMGYIAYASGQGAGVDYVKNVILDSNPLLEAFGNANTLRNDNSSRFGKYFEIQFDKRGNPCGGNIQNYLLEKSRVVNLSDGERNFHIFYQLVVGAPREVLTALQLYEPQYFHYLNQSSTVSVGTINDAEWYKETLHSMKTMNFTKHEQDSVFQILAAILHFGNVSFVENKEGYADVDPQTQEELDLAANYFGCEPSILKSAVLYRVITTGGAGGRMSTYNSPQNVEQAAGARDALAKDIYSRTFDFIVRKVNAALQANATPSNLVIGILDIFGFEIFKTNGFEQFCVRFVFFRCFLFLLILSLQISTSDLSCGFVVRVVLTFLPQILSTRSCSSISSS
jgi:myosin-1